MSNVTEYRFENATVRIHGKPPKQEILEAACIRFAMAVEAAKRESQNKAS